jgi:hypothetical protein
VRPSWVKIPACLASATITASTTSILSLPAPIARARLFDSDLFRRYFVATLRCDLNFKILGYVLMPEHFHLLIHPSAEADPSRII